jgi:hypothetical protein
MEHILYCSGNIPLAENHFFRYSAIDFFQFLSALFQMFAKYNPTHAITWPMTSYIPVAVPDQPTTGEQGGGAFTHM